MSGTIKNNQLKVVEQEKTTTSGNRKTYYYARGLVRFKNEKQTIHEIIKGVFSRTEAEQECLNLEINTLKNLKNHYLQKNPEFLNFNQLTEQMLSDHMNSPNPNRFNQYRHNAKILGKKLVTEIKQIDITNTAFARYPKLQKYKGKKLSQIYDLREREMVSGWFNTANTNVMIPIGKVLHYAHQEGMCPYVKLKYFEVLNPRNKRKVRFTYEEIKKCMEYDDFQIVLLFSFLLFTGCRISEALRIHWNDLDQNDNKVLDLPNNIIRIFQNKTGTWRTVPIHQNLSKIINMIENKDGYLFEWRDVKESKNTDRGLMPRWRKMLDFAGIKEFKGRHALRHTLASMLSDSGASTQELMTLIGWTDQRSVLRYAGTSQEKLVSIMNTLDS